MQFALLVPAETTIYGLRPATVAVLLSGVALVFAIRRWRMSMVRKQGVAGGAAAATDRVMERATMGNGLNVREVTAEIQSLLAEVEETARRVAAQIDNRRRALEQLMVEADEKIRKLEALTRGEVGGAESSGTVGSVSREAAQTLSRLRQERGAPPANEDPAYAPIYQLADEGKSAREIGQALGRQPGEIELILALRGRQRV
ncbi:MAG: hypothetical protein ACTHN5_07865 [Phycisphaerae bacterium]